MDSSELKRRTFHSVLWTVVRIGSGNVLTFVVFSMLARILTPTAFGVFALAGAFVEFTKIVTSAGLGDAVTRVHVLDEDLATSAFWGNLSLGLLIGAVTWSLAPFYAQAVGAPQVASVLRWLSVLVPVSALGGIHTARKLREFGHKSMAARNVASCALGGGCAVLMAKEGFGVWSLVVQAAVTDVVGVLFAWQAFPWIPRPRLSLRRLIEVAGFSASMMVTLLLWLILSRVQELIIGGFISVAAVGTYRIAMRVFDMLCQAAIIPVMTVSVVTLARLQADQAALASAYSRMLSLAGLVSIPAVVGTGLLADDLIVVLFGPQWTGSVIIVRLLACLVGPYPLNLFVGPPLAAVGRSRAILKVAAVQSGSSLVLSLIAAPFGLPAMAVACVLAAHLSMLYGIRTLRREIGIRAGEIGRALLPPVAAALVMALTLCVLGPVVHAHESSRILRLGIESLAGVLAYMAGLLLFGRRFLASHYQAFRSLLGRGSIGSVSAYRSGVVP
jgi:O-antigen/teichoic acid export membrane protein